MTKCTDDWRKDMGRCVLNSMGECLANMPAACLCHQMPRDVFLEARNRLVALVDGEQAPSKEG